MEGIAVTGGMIQALADHILFHAAYCNHESPDLSDRDAGELADLYTEVLKNTIIKQHRRLVGVTETMVAQSITESNLKRISLGAGNPAKPDDIAREFFQFARAHHVGGDLTSNIKTVQANSDNEEMFRRGFLTAIYDAWQAQKFDSDVALAFIYRMVSLIHKEETGTLQPFNPKESAAILNKYGMKACATMILFDYKNFCELCDRGTAKILGFARYV
jgi:hypothetical protein